MECYCCKTWNRATIIKHSVAYAKCMSCGSIYTTDNITSHIETENDRPNTRNEHIQNNLRIQRMETELGGTITRALDFGCGEGHLVHLMRTKGIRALGIDKHTASQLDQLTYGKYDAVSMIEVIEHLTNPREVFEHASMCMKVGGILMIETTFADEIKDIALETYVDPRIGHVNIISKMALATLCPSHLILSHFLNDNVAILRKI